jgi:hypothetical protein
MDFRRYERDEPEIPRPHPVWRGIGCVMMLVIPIFSFGAADVLLNQFLIPQGYVNLPYQLWGIANIPIVDWEIYNWKAVLALTVIVSFALYVVLLVFNSMIYGMTKTKNLRAFESDPVRYKKKKR